jgi:hypothetical protein
LKITLGSIVTQDGKELNIKQAREYLANKEIILPKQLALSIIESKIKNCATNTVKHIINR